MQQRCLETLRVHSGLARPGLDAGVERSLCLAVTAVPVQRSGTHRRRGLPDDLRRRSAAQQERHAQGGEVFAKGKQGMMQPPSGGSAKRPDARRFLVEYIERDGGAVLGCRPQRRVVRGPEVVPEPHDRRLHYFPSDFAQRPCPLGRILRGMICVEIYLGIRTESTRYTVALAVWTPPQITAEPPSTLSASLVPVTVTESPSTVLWVPTIWSGVSWPGMTW